MGALHRPQRQLLRAADQRLTPTALLGALALLWGGMLLGISFLEAWVKFRAPSLSPPEGLDVGRLDKRVATILAGGDPPAAPYHVLYIALEAVRLGVLLLVGGLVLRSLLPPRRSPS